MKLISVLPAAWLSMLSACALPLEKPAPPPQHGLDAAAVSAELARIAARTPEQQRRERVVPDTERRADDGTYVRHTALLEREAGIEAFERALESLDTSDAATPRVPPAVIELKPAPPPENGLDIVAVSAELARVAALAPEQRRHELVALDAERRVDDGKRFQYAALLEREEGIEAFERALKSLGAIDAATPRARAVIELMKRALRARIELRQQSAQAQVLQEKLDQIKALEKSLQQHSTPPRTP